MLKVIKNRFYDLIIVLVLVLNSLCFFIPKVTDFFIKINSYHNKILIFLIVLTLIFFMLMLKKNKIFYVGKIECIIIAFILMISILLLIQIITTNEPYYELISNSYYLYIILLYFLLKNFYEDRIETLIKIILVIGIIYTIANIIVYLLVMYLGYYNTYPLIHYVNGNLRLPQSADIIGFTCVLFLYSFLNESKKMKYLIGIIFTFLTLVLVSQVRMAILSVAITLSVMIIIKFRNKKNRFLYFIFFFYILLGIFLLMIKFGVTTKSILDLFIGEGQRQDSAMYRIIEIKYYSKYFFKNYLFGFGFTNNPKIIVYSLTDIGIFGFIFKFGVLGVIWLIYLAKYFYRSLKITKNKILTFGCITYYCFTFISLSMFDSQRIVFLPILLFMINESNKVKL